MFVNRLPSNLHILLLVFAVFLSLGCRFTVREIGFADIFPDPYRLYLFVDLASADKYESKFMKTTREVFAESNIRAETINIDVQTNHPAIRFFENTGNGSLPSIILVAPDENGRIISLESNVLSSDDALKNELQEIVISPVREKMLNYFASSYAVVLFFEGKNSTENKRIAEKLKESITEISRMMSRMPKIVKEPPRLIVLKQSDSASEEILRWSLCESQQDDKLPAVAILYGRGRRMGDCLYKEDIINDTFFRLLTLIGADCECGLERKWMSGKMIPLRWNNNVQDNLADVLGFDVENPLIKSEMSQILAIQSGRTGKRLEGFFEPKEFNLTTDLKQTSVVSDTSGVPEINYVTESGTSNSWHRTSKIWVSSVAFAVLIIIIGFVFYQYKSRI